MNIVFFIIVAAHAKSPAAKFQGKTARTPHTLRVVGGSTRLACSHAVHCCTSKIESTARHSSTSKTMKMKPTFFAETKIPVASCNFFLPDWNALHRRKLEKQTNSRGPSASYAAHPSRDHLVTDSVRVKLSLLSAKVSPVARLA